MEQAKKEPKKDPLEEIYGEITSYDEGYVPRDESDYEM